MQIDQPTLMKIGGGVVVLLLAVVFGLSGESDDRSPAASDKTVTLASERQPSAEPEEATASSRASTAPAAAPKSDGDFDYYLLVLSWSPTHCSSERGRGSDDDRQCRSGRPYGFVLHGLWPQYERGYPKDCPSSEPRRVDAELMDRMMKISPSEDLVQHEWEKHGTCSGLGQKDYFTAAALAVESVKVPRPYQAPQRPLVTTPDAVKRAFLDANGAIAKDGLSATCSRNELAEIWVCLDKDLRPRACSNEVRKKHCGARQVRMLAVRGDWPR